MLPEIPVIAVIFSLKVIQRVCHECRDRLCLCSKFKFMLLILLFFNFYRFFYTWTQPVPMSADNPIPASATRMPEWIDTTNLDTDLD